MKLHLRFFASICLMMAMSVSLFAQRAAVSGTVTDQSGAVIPGATVTALMVSQGLKREATTGAQGTYAIPLLPPGRYTVTATCKGFTPREITDVILNVGDQVNLNIQLTVGGVAQSVTVEAEATLIPESPAVSTLVNRQFVENMPLNGRSFQSLLQLTPGIAFVKVDTNPFAGGTFSVNGQRANSNYFTVDGVGANYASSAGFGSFSGQSSAGTLPPLTAQGGTNSLVSIDALQEFQIQTSTYAPEYGRMPGGQISLITRSGSNGFHGDVFEYFRNDVLDARDWFANYNNLPKARERQNDFGGVVGGPIWKNKTFFFFSYEGLRLRQPVTGTMVVPDLATRNAIAAVNPAEAAIINMWPLPNGSPTTANFANYNAAVSSPSTLNAYSIRIDDSIKNNLTLFGHYTHSPSYTGAFTTNFADMRQLTWRNEAATLGLTWVISPSMTNDLRANYSQVRDTSLGQPLSQGGSVVPPITAPGMFPAGSNLGNYEVIAYVYSAPITGSGFVYGTGNDNWNRQVNVVDTFSLVKGTHQLKFGYDYRWLSPILNRAGGNFMDYFIDLQHPGSLYLLQLAQGGTETIPVFHNYSAYFQDTWKVTPRLTLTYGLRWDANPSPGWKNNSCPSVLSGLGSGGTVTLLPCGTPEYKSTWANFAPRFGVAYRLRQSPGHETIVRGGTGVFYDTGGGALAATAFDHIYPYFSSAVYFSVPFPPNQPQPIPGVTPPQQFWSADPNLKLPYTIQWNATVEQFLGSNQSLTLSYIGSVGRRLLFLSEYSTPVSGFTGNIPAYLQTNASKSNYNALQAQFQRRLSNGLQGLVSYTWSHSLDTSSGDDVVGFPPQFLNLKIEYGPSDFDVRHTLAGALTYDIPAFPSDSRAIHALTHGWGVDIRESIRTAFPVNVTASTPFGNLTFTNHAQLVPGQPEVLYGSQYPGGKELNTKAFVAAPANVLGNFPRNSLRGFNAVQTDFALRREFPIWAEKLKMQFRFEFFNLFNQPNFMDYGGSITTSNYNVSTKTLATGLGGVSALYQMGGPRSGQASVKFIF